MVKSAAWSGGYFTSPGGFLTIRRVPCKRRTRRTATALVITAAWAGTGNTLTKYDTFAATTQHGKYEKAST